AEVRRAREVDHRLPERILRGRRCLEGHRLHALWAADREVAELGRVVHAQIICQTLVGGVQQDEPDGLAIGLAFVERQAHSLLAEVDLDGALQGQVIARQQAALWSETLGRPRPLTLSLGHRRPYCKSRAT